MSFAAGMIADLAHRAVDGERRGRGSLDRRIAALVAHAGRRRGWSAPRRGEVRRAIRRAIARWRDLPETP